MYKVIVIDFDGMLLNSDYQFDLYMIDIVCWFDCDGVQFVIVMGCYYVDVVGICDVFGIWLYLIMLNGVCVYVLDDMKIYGQDIDVVIVCSFVQLEVVGVYGCVIVNLFINDGWLIDCEVLYLFEFYQDLGFWYEVIDMVVYDGVDIVKVLYIGELVDLVVVVEQMCVQFGDMLYVMYLLFDCFEVMIVNVLKGCVLCMVFVWFGVDIGYCIVFGDNMNDIDLFEMVGYVFMMNNVNFDLIVWLLYVLWIGNNFDVGVVCYLCMLFLLEDDVVVF